MSSRKSEDRTEADTVCPCTHVATTPRRADPRGGGRDHRHRGLRLRSPCAGSPPRPTCRCPRSSATSAPRTPSWPRWSARAARTRSAIELRTKHGAGRRRRRGARRGRRLRGGRPAADAHAGPGAPLSRAVGAARHRPARPPPWVRWAFAPQLAGRSRAGKAQLEDLLVVATDVYTWKLLRIDRGLSARATGAAMTELCEAVVAR